MRQCLFYFLAGIIGLIGLTTAALAEYDYQVHKVQGQVVHLVTLSPNEYAASLVRAQGDRETVASMAKRTQANIAINGGFFEMGETKEGLPSGSLVIDGKVYKVKNGVQALAIIHSKTLSIDFTNAKQYFQTHPGSAYSFVSGIPLLIYNGKIVEKNLTKTGNFYQKPHARTAIGIRAKGEIVLCLVEHAYAKEVSRINVANIPYFIKKKLSIVSAHYRQNQGEFTVKDLKKIVKDELSEGIQGLTIPELAHFMKKSGCEFALNLDGGGSSTLWIDGKVVNATIGDEDEGKGIALVRPVSDAIVFHKK